VIDQALKNALKGKNNDDFLLLICLDTCPSRDNIKMDNVKLITLSKRRRKVVRNQ